MTPRPTPRGLAATPAAARRRRSRRATAALLASAVALGCSGARVPPQRPTLPAVKFVAPCDAQAVVGLTGQGVEDLKARDAAWRAQVERLEAMIREQQ